MRKILIHIDDGIDELDDASALSMVQMVAREGRVSKTGKRDHYCHVTVWKSGITVYATKTKAGTDIFRITR